MIGWQTGQGRARTSSCRYKPQTFSGMVLANLDKPSVEVKLMERCIIEPARIVQRAADPSTVTPHVLVGAGVRFNDELGRAHDYAAIVAVIPSNNAVGDLVLLQYFERQRGEPSTQRLMPLVELSGSDRWVLYKSVAEMIWAYAQEEGRKAETLARLNGTLPPEKPGEDDRLETPLAKRLGGLLPSGIEAVGLSPCTTATSAPPGSARRLRRSRHRSSRWPASALRRWMICLSRHNGSPACPT